MPPIGEQEFSETEYEKAVTDLLAEMKDLSEEELQDQVYRQFAYRLCPECQARFLANPLGKPRDHRDGQN
ncbi:MAG TPA: hypothetical protein VHP11_07135 [Tepidisphaeraceae bacterium]|nr:hypothetical protein [Tepidisphaeraceae bacterium]